MSYPHYPLIKELQDFEDPQSFLRRILRRVDVFAPSLSRTTPIAHLLGLDRRVDPRILSKWSNEAIEAYWRAPHLTEATIGIALTREFGLSPISCPPQYKIFGRFPENSSITTFNWDRLAVMCCPQRPIVSPHMHQFYNDTLVRHDGPELLYWSQWCDTPEGGKTTFPGVIGDEATAAAKDHGDGVQRLWQQAERIIAIGFSFGLGQQSTTDDDAPWRDKLVEALLRSRRRLYLVSPNAQRLVEELTDQYRISIDAVPIPLKWNLLAAAILHLLPPGATTASVVPQAKRVLDIYDRFETRRYRLRNSRDP